MTDDIPLIPEIPQALREAAQSTGRLIPFIGAGVSQLAGCPGWSGFADGIFNCFVEQRKYSFAQMDQIRHLDPRVKISLAMSMREELDVTVDFKRVLYPTEGLNHPNGRRVYSQLSRLGRTFVTTNYDEWLDRELTDVPMSIAEEGSAASSSTPSERSVYCRVDDLTPAHLNQSNTVLHLHGSIKEPDTMILSTAQYIRHYANDRRLNPSERENPVLTFLEYLFANKTVLFIGYGLKDVEILEYIVLKARLSAKKGTEPAHFMLQGFYSHERELMLAMRRYYRECGIELLPFLKDQHDYAQLAEVLADYAAKIPASDVTVLQQLKEMGGLLDA